MARRQRAVDDRLEDARIDLVDQVRKRVEGDHADGPMEYGILYSEASSGGKGGQGETGTGGRLGPLFLLPQFREHTRHQIEPRYDRAAVDILIAGMVAPAGEAKTFHHDRLAGTVGIPRIGGAAGHLDDIEGAFDLGVDRLSVPGERAAAVAGDEGRAAWHDLHHRLGVGNEFFFHLFVERRLQFLQAIGYGDTDVGTGDRLLGNLVAHGADLRRGPV